MESLSLEVMNQPTDVTPFLNGLKEKSLFFENAFANGRRSIDAVPSILGSLPALMNEPFINTDYRANHVRGLPNILAEQGLLLRALMVLFKPSLTPVEIFAHKVVCNVDPASSPV